MANNQNITLFLCGDVMLGRGIDQILPHPNLPELYESYVRDAREYVQLAEQKNGAIATTVPFSYIWGAALGEFARRKPDVKIINLETTITTSGDWVPKGINYRMHPDNIACLTVAHIDCCVLGNNHMLDFSYSGLFETLDSLSKAGIISSGAGRNSKEAETPAVLNIENKGRVLVFSLGMETSGVPPDWAANSNRPGVNFLEDLSTSAVSRIAELVQRFKQPDDIAIVSIHWGGNWGYDIEYNEIRFAHCLIDQASINIVHGHSSHHPKGIEVYHGCPIFYGCGDFITDYEGITGYEQYRGDLGLMYFVTMCRSTGTLASLEMVPTQMKRLRVNHASAQDARWLQNLLNRESNKFGTQIRTTSAADRSFFLDWDKGLKSSAIDH